ncbi:hypothetical protein BGZ89_003847 [Linnemannia elongata]|nr:hypothetical protein BGZ89_003847 [Linnemannia elongata]
MYLVDRKDAACRSKNPSSQIQEYYHNVLYREATWSLAEPILEQLESLSFPISDIRRYLLIVGRLVRLARVHVHLDMVFYCECCDESNIAQEPRRMRKKRAFHDLIQFVEAHVRLFPGCLKTVTTSDACFWEEGSQSCPAEVEYEIYKMLPSQFQPTFISEANCQTLSYVRIKALRGPENVQTIYIGRDWCTLPCMTALVLQARAHRLVLDPLLFTRLPRLKNPTIKDETFEYSCENVVPCEPAHVSSLSESMN